MQHAHGTAKTGRKSLSFVQLTLNMILSVVLLCLPVQAEEEQKEESEYQLGEITVTATKMSTEVDKVPTNIAVISREELDTYPGHYSVITLLRDLNIPGLYFTGSAWGNANGDISTSSRGGEVSNWGMKVMVNGVEFNSANGIVGAGRLAIHDIERVEVIKTPSAEYGDQAIGGVINIITRTAKEPLEARTGIAFSSLGDGNAYGVINGSSEKWQYYLDVSGTREDAYQEATYQHGDNVYAKVRYALNDNAQLSFHGSYNDTKGNYAVGLTRKQFEEDSSQNPNTGADQYFEGEDKLGALVYEQQLGPHELMAKLEVQSSTYLMYWGGYNDTDEWQAHPEVSLRLNHDLAGMTNTLVIGGEYRYHDIKVKRYSASSFYNLGSITHNFSREDVSYAGYLQDELRITDAFTMTAGLRYDFFDLEQVGHTANSKTWDQEVGDFSPKIGFTYQLCEEVNFFAGINSGIKSPVRLEKFNTNGKLEPEKLRSYEVGLRGTVWGWLGYDVALFRQNVTDKFVKHSVDFNAEYENAGETTAQGIELGAHAKLPHDFYASTSFTYQQSEFDEFVSQGVDYSGNQLTGVPDVMFAFTLGYRNERLGDISLNPVYTGMRYFNYANTNKDDAFWVLNARYTKQFGQVELYLAANNLFDEDAVGSGSGDPGKESLYPITGFNAMLGMNVKF